MRLAVLAQALAPTLLLAACSGAPDADPPDVLEAGPPPDRALREEIPGLRDQPTDRGRRIGALHAFGGRIVVAYGDYSGNTGPIAVVSLDPVDGSLHASAPLDTEELLRFHVHDGALYTPAIDPDGHQDVGSAFRLGADLQWTELSPIPDAVHVFSLCTFQGRLFASTGSLTGQVARVVSTGDGGATWQDEHTTQSPPDAFTRYTHLGAAGGTLVATGFVTGSPNQTFALAFDGDAWTELSGVPAAGALVPIPVGDALVLARFDGDPGKGGRYGGAFLGVDAGLEAADDRLPEGLINWAVDGAGAIDLALARAPSGGEVSVLRPTDGGWTVVLTPPGPDRGEWSALAEAGGLLWLGTSAGDLYRYSP